MFINGKQKETATYDAIVIGSGISGGWAAMELCKKGMKTLLLERGRNVEHIKDYTTAFKKPWELPYGGECTPQFKMASPLQSKGADGGNQQFYINDTDHPYVQQKPFNWYRGYQVGGKSLLWGRQCYRFSDLDFEANQKDGIAVDWPIRYKDLTDWYSYVEFFIGISGNKENLPHLPDSIYQPGMPLNCVENHLADSIKKNYKDRLLTIARIANLTQPHNNRQACQNRNLCTRGCPFGASFTSNSTTIPVALQTGNLTLRPFSIVTEILYNENKRRADGVRIIDTNTFEHEEYYAKIIFVNASTIPTTSILLNSKSRRFPDGLGNDSGQLGHNLMDHHSSAGASGSHHGYKDMYYKGRRPCGFLIPRFRNLYNEQTGDFTRGYNIQGHGERSEWRDTMNANGFGEDFKKTITTPGPWTIWMAGWGECLPYYDNQITLSETLKDKWGQPLPVLDFEFKDNENKMMSDIRESSFEMLSKAGFENLSSFNYQKVGGDTVHEMGTARMGLSSNTSVLNKHNQLHDVKNVFVTDGSCMTSSACQNPSLTYMALTARACDFAINELKNNNL